MPDFAAGWLHTCLATARGTCSSPCIEAPARLLGDGHKAFYHTLDKYPNISNIYETGKRTESVYSYFKKMFMAQ